MLQRTGGSRFQPWVATGRSWVFIRVFSPAGPLIQIQTCRPWRIPLDMGYSCRAARGAIHVKHNRKNLEQIKLRDFFVILNEITVPKQACD